MSSAPNRHTIGARPLLFLLISIGSADLAVLNGLRQSLRGSILGVELFAGGCESSGPSNDHLFPYLRFPDQPSSFSRFPPLLFSTMT